MNNSRASVVRRLRSIPLAFDISAAELCRRIKIGSTAWANYVSETGKHRIPVRVAERLCDEFGLTLDWIYRGRTALIPAEVVKAEREAA